MADLFQYVEVILKEVQHVIKKIYLVLERMPNVNGFSEDGLFNGRTWIA